MKIHAESKRKTKSRFPIPMPIPILPQVERKTDERKNVAAKKNTVRPGNRWKEELAVIR